MDECNTPFLTKDLSSSFILWAQTSAIPLAICFTGWWRSGLSLLGFALVTLWIAATPFFANWLDWRRIEFPPVKVETLPQSHAVVLLGGFGLDSTTRQTGSCPLRRSIVRARRHSSSIQGDMPALV